MTLVIVGDRLTLTVTLNMTYINLISLIQLPMCVILYTQLRCVPSTKCKFRSMPHTGQTYHMTLTFNLGLWRSWHLPLMRVYVLHPHTNFEVLRPYCSEDM